MKREGLGGQFGGQWIVHICRRDAWQDAQENGEYSADSLKSEGFIHCSTPEQVLDVANRYYAGVHDLVLLWIDPLKIHVQLRWEAAEDGEIYPHVYGGIDIDAIQAVADFLPGASGIFVNIPHM